MSKELYIDVDKYGEHINATRLSVGIIDENGYGDGTRIKGSKYSSISEGKSIQVLLSVSQAETLQKELGHYIKRFKEEGNKNE